MSEKKNKSLRRQEDVRLLDEEVFEEFEDEEDFSESDNFSADDSFDDDDIDDEDGDINPKMEKAITIMGIAAGVVIIIIIIYLCITLAGGMKKTSAEKDERK